jgi:hypothetical protein
MDAAEESAAMSLDLVAAQPDDPAAPAGARDDVDAFERRFLEEDAVGASWTLLPAISCTAMVMR